MTSREPDPHIRADHPYPTLPPGVRVCDDDRAAGDWFFYRDRELVVHRGRTGPVRDRGGHEIEDVLMGRPGVPLQRT